MRTYKEIQLDVIQATNVQDVEALSALVEELRAIDSPDARSSMENTLGILHWTKDEHHTALQHYQRALEMSEEMGDHSFSATIRGNIANVYLDTSDYPAALKQLHEALTVLEEAEDYAGISRVTNSMAIVHAILGDSEQALELFQRNLALQTELGDRHGVAGTHGNMSHVYTGLGRYSDALENNQRSMAILEELGARNRMATVHGMIGSLYEAIGDFPKAAFHHHACLDLNKEFGIPTGVATGLANLANVHTSTGEYDKALELHEKALQIQRKHGNQLGEASGLGNIGQTLYKMNEKERALDYTRRACDMLQDLGSRDTHAIFMGNAITLLLELGNVDEAKTLLLEYPVTSSTRGEIAARYHENQALLHELEGDLDAARVSLQTGLEVIIDGMRDREGILHEKLRDLALKRNDLPAYVEHNDAFQRIEAEIRGKDATQKLTMMQAERTVEAERREREKERALLYGALPESVATRMLRGESVSGDHVEGASVLFLDIARFTDISDRIPPGHVVHLLEQIFTALDDVVERYGVTKIKTIGDSYMAVAGVPEPLDDHAQRAAECALDMMSTLKDLSITMPPDLGDTSWVNNVDTIEVRIGVHCGPITSGVIGTKRLQYDVWGDTVNVASRMESTGEPGRIQCSDAFVGSCSLRSQDDGALRHPAARSNEGPLFTFTPRGSIDIKGKGTMKTYWLE